MFHKRSRTVISRLFALDFGEVFQLAGICLLTLSLAAGAAIGDWRIGVAGTDITPSEPVPMAGYAGRQVLYKSVLSPLFAKAIAIEDAQGHRALIVSCDIVGFQRWFTEPLVERLMRRTGLPRERILLAASHTHTGPLVGYDSRFPFDRPILERIERYVARLCDDIVRISLEAIDDLEPAELFHRVGHVEFPMNRRELTAAGKIRLGANPDGPVDRSVPILCVRSPEGRVRAVLFGASCHPTTLGANHSICADYPGFARTYIEAAFPGAQALFLQGCAGDTGPQPTGNVELARKHGRALGSEVVAQISRPGRAIHGPLRAAFEKVDTPLMHLDGPDGAAGWPYANLIARSLRQLMATGESIPTLYPCPVAIWQFGDDLTLVTLSGEAVVDYVTFIKEAIGPDDLWIASYAHDNFGYLPSARVLREGGYETRGLIYAADRVGMDGAYGIFSPDAEKVIVKAVKDQAVRVGRPGVER